MITFEPWAVCSTSPNIESRSTTTAMLNTDIQTLTVFKNTTKATAVKAIFESAVVILTLVRVRLYVPFQFAHKLIGGMTRMG